MWFSSQKSIARRASWSSRLPSAANRRHLLRSLSASVLARRSSSSSSPRTLRASSRARDSAERRAVREVERRACSACCFSRAVVSADISRRAFSNSSWFWPLWYPNKYAEKTTRTAAISRRAIGRFDIISLIKYPFQIFCIPLSAPTLGGFSFHFLKKSSSSRSLRAFSPFSKLVPGLQ